MHFTGSVWVRKTLWSVALIAHYPVVQGGRLWLLVLGGTNRHCRALGKKLLPEEWPVAIRVQQVLVARPPSLWLWVFLSWERALTDKDEWCGVVHARAVVVTSYFCTSQQVIIKINTSMAAASPRAYLLPLAWTNSAGGAQAKSCRDQRETLQALAKAVAHWRKCWCLAIFIAMSVKTCCQLTPSLTQHIFSKAEGKWAFLPPFILQVVILIYFWNCTTH